MPTANQVTVESGYCRIRLCRELVVAAPTAVDRGGTSFEDCEPSRIDLLPKKHQYRLRVVDHVTLVYLARRRRVVEQSDVATLLRLPARVVQRRNPENSFAIPQIDACFVAAQQSQLAVALDKEADGSFKAMYGRDGQLYAVTCWPALGIERPRVGGGETAMPGARAAAAARRGRCEGRGESSG